VGIERSGKGGGGRGFEGDSLHPIHPTRKIPPNILTKLALENEKGTNEKGCITSHISRSHQRSERRI
jgi:hypothetical protein